MTVKPILTLSRGEIADSDSLLRQRSEPVRSGDDISGIIQDLRDTFYGCEIALGLAAIQIGYPKRVFILNLNKSDRSGEKVFINPELIERDEQMEAVNEVCMSIPNLVGNVYRPTKVTINSDLLTQGPAKMSGLGADQGTVAVFRSTGEPGNASPIRGGGRTVKRMRRREPGKMVAV
jgi:peptide deformylase